MPGKSSLFFHKLTTVLSFTKQNMLIKQVTISKTKEWRLRLPKSQENPTQGLHTKSHKRYKTHKEISILEAKRISSKETPPVKQKRLKEKITITTK